ncbi:MAG: type VI secretion system protein TssA [Paracoccaceae bacterium]
MTDLLQSFGEDAPSGEDLEYEQVFTDLIVAAQPTQEKQFGDQIIPSEDPDYRDVATKARAVLAQSHDLRAGAYLATAELRVNGLEGFSEVAAFFRGALEDYWSTCHPQLDEEDDNDPTMRVNTVAELANRDTVIRALRLAPLTDSRTFGRICWRDVQVANGEISAQEDDDVPDSAAVAAAFRDTDDDALSGLRAAAESALSDIQAVTAKFDAETPGRGPDLEPLERLLRQITNHLIEAGGGVAEITEDAKQTADIREKTANTGAIGAINSINDVHTALDRIIAYYKRSEPSSPVPILLERAKRLVGADFLEIVKDMAPEGVDNVHLIGGIEDEDD